MVVLLHQRKRLFFLGIVLIINPFEERNLMDAKQNNMPSVTNFAVMAAAFEGGLAVFALIFGAMGQKKP